MRRFAAAILWLSLATIAAHGATLSLLTSRSGLDDSLFWSAFGGNHQTVLSGSSAYTAEHNLVTVSFSGNQAGEIFQQSSTSWNGNFPASDWVLWNGGYGPDTLTFSNPIASIVFQVQTNYPGAFSTQISAYNASTLLGSYTVSGDSELWGVGTAAFLGVHDTSAEITKIVITGLTATQSPQSFGINELSLGGVDAPAPPPSGSAPEPASFALIGAGLLAVVAQRRFSKARG